MNARAKGPRKRSRLPILIAGGAVFAIGVLVIGFMVIHTVSQSGNAPVQTARRSIPVEASTIPPQSQPTAQRATPVPAAVPAVAAPGPDPLALQLQNQRTRDDLRAAVRDAVQGEIQPLKNELRQTVLPMAQQVDALTSKVAALERQQSAVAATQRQVTIVKPVPRPAAERVQKPSQQPSQARSAAQGILPPADIRVMATVADRAWIRIGDREQSVVPGDVITPTLQFRVDAIDGRSGVVVVSPVR